ncbi:LysR family transcriptional regulator [Citricoccus sp. SGAir0253]|uniref:LysR family transcriptional regulator n=1 Tax=Citricoccus sp. SGAir0253 TaxID=2567881 RepID=UPI0010CD37C5|nr:LysR family transcriptional regulator [Citricoccus sp. SGAir0253]QCU79134.1 LysR family transcriptional regulator [Citricoccus sp. SGAir0253]
MDHPSPGPGPRFTLRQLELFVAAAEQGSFTRAAQQLFVTPNAVAQAVGELEGILGVTLAVRRRARGLTLTPAGTRLLEGARALLRQATDLGLSVGEGAGEPSGPVAVGFYSTLAPTLAPELWERLAERHPDVELSVVEGTTDELVDQLHAGRLDLLIAYEVALPPGLAVRPLFTARPWVVLPRPHRLAGERAVDLRDLADDPLVLFDLPPSGRNTLELLRRRGVRPRIAHRTTDFELVHSLVGRGMGYGIQLQRSVVEVSREGRPLAILPITPEPEAEPVVVAWAGQVPLTSRAGAVVALARECLPAR